MDQIQSAPPSTSNTKDLLAHYREPSLRRSLLQLVLTLGAFFLFWGLAWYCLQFGYWATLLLAVPAAGFLVRLFMIQHDCGHHSFFRSAAANDWVGFALGVLTLTPYHRWRRSHALHHATSGDLDRRGVGDVKTLTVREYLRLSSRQRLAYRIYRHPVFLLCLVPLFFFTILQRFSFLAPHSWRKERLGAHVTNLLLVVIVVGMSLWIGFWPLVLVHLPIAFLASVVGVWLFVVQHQYEHTYWRHHDQWDYAEASLAGSSHLVLPRPLQWLTASIGLHHLHHLDSRIPNYRLQECLDQNPQMQAATRITLSDGLHCLRFALWDEDRGVMVGFGDLDRG
jgi:omega-6 fatty acid desaturase (delta-12 desaturase)